MQVKPAGKFTPGLPGMAGSCRAFGSGWADRAAFVRSGGAARATSSRGRAPVKKPMVVPADEPTGNPDESTRDEIIALFERLWREYGLTLILVTHDSTVASRTQRIGLMRNGQLEIKQDTRHGAS